jgi:hypothetical protein
MTSEKINPNMYIMFSTQNINLLNASAACFISDGLIIQGMIKSVNILIGGG